MHRIAFGLEILVLLALAGTFLIFPFAGAKWIIISCLILSTLFFFMGFAILNRLSLRGIFKKESYQGISTLRMIGSVLTGLALSAMVMGIMFRVLFWPGGVENVILGLFGIAIAFAFSLVKVLSEPNEFYQKLALRLAIYGLIGGLFYFSTNESLINFRYRNYPTFAKALRASVAHPQDEALWLEVEEEQEKIYIWEETADE